MNENDIWLIAGLGNPEAKYDGTRHNAGFAALDALADKWHISVGKTKFQGLWGQGEVDGHKVVLLKPLTYMNLSGDSIAPMAGFFKIPADHVLVLCDDITSAVEQAVDAAAPPAGSEPGLAAVDTDGLYAFLQAQLGDATTADCLNKIMANRLPTRITALAGQAGDKLQPADLTLKKRAGAENCYDFSAALLTATDSTAAAQVSGTITMVKEDGHWKAAAITLNL